MLRSRVVRAFALCLFLVASCGDDGSDTSPAAPEGGAGTGSSDSGGELPGAAGSAAGRGAGAGAGGASAGPDASAADGGDLDGGGDAGALDAGALDAGIHDAGSGDAGDAAFDAGDAADAAGDGGDACAGDDACNPPPEDIVDCGRELNTTAGEVCSVIAGSATKLITGDILLPEQVLRGGQVLIDASGLISCVGCDCEAQTAAAGATQIVCPDGVVSPGLINAHDHLTFDFNSPPPPSAVRYEQRHDWRVGARQHAQITVPGGASTDQLRWAELRFVLGGATAAVSAGGAAGLLRNLDNGSLLEGLGLPAVRSSTFPLGDIDGTQLESGCAYPNITTAASIEGLPAFFAHVAEGIDAVARNEFTCLHSSANGGQDLTEPQSAFVHGAALGPDQFAIMAAEGTALVWSPRSNISLYGDTAQITVADALGVSIALGTDWTPSGSMNVLRELRCAADFNRIYLDGYFSDRQLFQMVTVNPAAAAAMDQSIGLLASGRAADIAIFDGHEHADYGAVVEAEPADVALVMRGGRVLYGDAALVQAIPGSGSCDELDVCAVAKRACLEGEIGKTLAALQTSVGAGTYPLFDCDVPPYEPTCVPSRGGSESVEGSSLYKGQSSTGDADGDGIEDALDNCPHVFNPVRPVDQGMQANADGDSAGDACDACPLVAGAAACES